MAVWKALRSGLPAGWRAWHSLKLRIDGAWEGEGDFVIAAPSRGLLVLEVKGGAIELHDGRWSQNGRVMTRVPREQALGFVRRLAEKLEAKGVEVPPFGVACAFPDVDFSDDQGPTSGDLEGIVLGPRHIEWIGQALPGLLERAIPARPMPASDAWLDAVHRLWGDSWVPRLSIADEVRDADTRVVALVSEQLDVLAAAEDNPRALVTGGAGTGKTLLARELCTRAAARNQRVLYLCFTDALGSAVDRGFAAARAAGADLRAVPIRRYAGELLAARGVAIPADPAFWETASQAAADGALPAVRPELVVVDEAQDLDAGDWALVHALAGDRPLWVLGDERQAFWRRPAFPDAITTGAIRLKLSTQLRCPTGIAALAERYLEQPDGAPTFPTSTTMVRLVETTPGAELDQLGTTLTELLRGGAKPADIAILTLAGQAASPLLKHETLAGQRLVRADSPDASQHLIADTFLRFKGLERPFVILVELAAGHASQYERRMHIAITRATSRLLVVATAADRAADARLAPLLTA